MSVDLRNARRERLTRELGEAELALDALHRSKQPGMMRTIQAVAGQRAKVFGLRLELAQMDHDDTRGKSDDARAKREELRQTMAGLRLGIKEAELSARASSKQATEDEIPELMQRLTEASQMSQEVDGLHH